MTELLAKLGSMSFDWDCPLSEWAKEEVLRLIREIQGLDKPSSYYDRRSIVHLDGTSVFQNEQDRKGERSAAHKIENEWGCEICSFGALAPIDWYAMRYGRIVGLIEIKTRTHSFGRYPTVFLNFRKWLALKIGAIGMNAPGIFIVQYVDCIRWVAISDIPLESIRLAGCAHRVKSDNDREPVIDVPISVLLALEEDHGLAA